MLQRCVCLTVAVVIVVVCELDVMYFGYIRCVLEQKLLLTAYRKSYMGNLLVAK